ncbi:MAG: hypothetical protein HYX72_14620 [Acidobacteria bacterium]|nr:hypothetical protein [Acidobacteriota bacterium]
MRWPDGKIRCLACGNDRITKFDRKGKTGKIQHLYRCLEKRCDYQFSVTKGTIFEDSHKESKELLLELFSPAELDSGANFFIAAQHDNWHFVIRALTL